MGIKLHSQVYISHISDSSNVWGEKIELSNYHFLLEYINYNINYGELVRKCYLETHVVFLSEIGNLLKDLHQGFIVYITNSTMAFKW